MLPSLSDLALQEESIDARLAQSHRDRPTQTVLSSVEKTIRIKSKAEFVESMTDALFSEPTKKWATDQENYHIRMDLDLLSPRADPDVATLVIFSVDANMLITDLVWKTINCTEVTPYIRADGCEDGGSTNKIFYKNALSLKQFILHDDLPISERLEVLGIAYDIFVGDEKTPGLSNIQTFSGIPFFHMKPFSQT